MNNCVFVSLLYPNKHGEWTFLEGALLSALGLRKQNIKNKIICMVTPDITIEITNILKIVYDEIKIVDYISPWKVKLSNTQTNYVCPDPQEKEQKGKIEICGDIFDLSIYTDSVLYTDMCNIFTKLHIFDPEKFPYDKVIFIDNDLIPLEKFNLLTKLNTPAGWLEKIMEIENNINIPSYTRIWDIWTNITHNKLIPKELTEIYKEPGSSINAGLLVIKPNKQVYDNMINKLKQQKNQWFGPEHIHKGMIGLNRCFSDKYYFPEQDFLTQEFSGLWHMIDGRYCMWGVHENNNKVCYGMHMAGLKYNINDRWENYKTWMVQIPQEDGFNKITNQMVIWGISKFPELKSILMKNLKIYINNKLIDFDKITFFIFINLTDSQQELHNSLYNKFNEDYSLF